MLPWLLSMSLIRPLSMDVGDQAGVWLQCRGLGSEGWESKGLDDISRARGEAATVAFSSNQTSTEN